MKKLVSRRQHTLIVSLSILFSFLAFGMAMKSQTMNPAVLAQVALYPDLIVHNAKIYTMDSGLSTYEAMAVRGSRIWLLGTNADIRPLAGPQTEVIDAKGRAVLPGLIDAHTHPHLWGMMHLGYKYDPQLQWLYVDGKDLQELKSRLGESVASRIRQAGKDKWVIAPIARNLAPEALRGGITQADLDRIAPDTPLAVMTGITGGTLTNTKAKQEMGRLLGSEMDGLRIWYLVTYDIIMKGKTEQVADLIANEMAENLPLGVTTVMSHIESPQVLRSVSYLDRQGKMPVRWGWVHRIGFSLAKDPAEFYALLGDFLGQGSEYFWNIGVGQEGWANQSCSTAVPRNPQDQPKDTCEIYPGKRGYEGHLAAARKGLRLANLHLYTDKAADASAQIADTIIQEGVKTLEEIKKEGWGFDHGTFLDPQKAELFAKYGFWMAFQARSIANEEQVLRNYGPEYLPWVVPVKAFADAGARFTLNTDSHLVLGTSHEEMLQDQFVGGSLWGGWPEEFRNSIWPWLGVWITREISGKVYSPQNKLDRTTVMKAWTIWSAQFLLREKDLGSLEPGKLADFIITDKDYFSVPEQEINSIKTLLTALGGKVKFRASDF